jgi:hypothetical protein
MPPSKFVVVNFDFRKLLFINRGSLGFMGRDYSVAMRCDQRDPLCICYVCVCVLGYVKLYVYYISIKFTIYIYIYIYIH